jgi:hypothetical protein
LKHPDFGKAFFDMALCQSRRLGVAAGARDADFVLENNADADADESSSCPQAGIRATRAHKKIERRE